MKTHLRKALFLPAVILSLLLISESIIAQQKGRKKHAAKKVVVHHKKVHSKHVPHKHYSHHPKRGTVLKSINTGAVSIRFKENRFHYHNGVFYKPSGQKYIVARAPIGMGIKVLPPRYKRFILGKRTYFYYYGTFYQKTVGANEFEVIEAPAGAVVDAIPEGYETVVIDGVYYYTLDDVQYKPTELSNGEIGYEVVGPVE